MSHCDEPHSFPGPNLCDVFSKSYPIYSTLITKSVPPLTCPVKAVSNNNSQLAAHFFGKLEYYPAFSFGAQGSYDMSAGYVDTTYVFSLALTGYSWFSNYKVYEKKDGEKTKRAVFCLKAKFSMFIVRKRNH